MYAIYKTLREVYEATETPQIESVMVLSDALSMLQLIESWYRRGHARELGRVKGGMMVGAICGYMAALGDVALVYIPAYVGSYPSAYADAIAKAYLAGRRHAAR